MGINVNLKGLNASKLDEAVQTVTNMTNSANEALAKAGSCASEPIGSAIKAKLDAFNSTEIEELSKAVKALQDDLANLNTNYNKGIETLVNDINSINITVGGN